MALKSPQVPEVGSSGSSVVKQLRAAFESQLITDGGSAIETWLPRVAADERRMLFIELLDAEISHLQQCGRQVRMEDYLARFPELSAEVESVFSVLAAKALLGSGDRTMDSTIDRAPSQKALVDDEPHWTSGAFVGRYRLDHLLGHGAFGEVWKGFDPELHRTVAIKLPRKRILRRVDLSLHFRDEARRAASLKHDGIVPVYDIGQSGQSTFIVSEFIDGPTLAERMKSGPISRDEAIRIVGELARSLHQAHLAGLVHRDMKPSNVLMRPNGSPAITDFGLAISEREQSANDEGIVGTAAYMSPEQARGEGHLVDGRSDLYSLGVMLYQFLTGRHPFQFKSSKDLLEQVIHREPRPLRAIDDTIPPALERICLRCLSKNVSSRYSTGRELADDLQNWNAPPRKWTRPQVLGLTALAAALTIAFGLFAFGSKGKEPQTNPQDALKTVTPTNQWLSLLSQPLVKVAALKGEPTDYWQLNESQRTLNLRSDRNMWILAAPHSGRSPFRLQGSVLIDEGFASVGFVWGLAEDTNAFPKKQRQCFALLIQRFAPKEPAILSLQHMTIGDFLQKVPWLEGGVPTWVNGYRELARTPFKLPMDQFLSLEVAVDGSNVEVFADGASVWKPTIVDQQMRESLAKSEGPLGLAGHGKSVVFRDAAVKFLTSTRKGHP